MIAILDNPVVMRAVKGRLRGVRAVLWPGTALFIAVGILLMILYMLQENVISSARTAFHIYFWVVVCIDLVVLVLISAVNTATHFARERDQRTLEFLRISRLSSMGITLGHLMGGLAVPLILAGVTLPLVVLGASIAGISPRDILEAVVLVGVYALFASSFALAVGMTVKKSTTAGGAAAAPIVFFGLFGTGWASFQGSWWVRCFAFVSPGNFLIPMITDDLPFGPPRPTIPLYGIGVDSFQFNMGVLVFLSLLLIVGVSRKVERETRSFLSPLQAFVVVSILGLVLGGLAYSAVDEAVAYTPTFGMILGYVDPEVVATGFASFLMVIFVTFICVTSPTRERILRRDRDERFGGEVGATRREARRSRLYLVALFFMGLLLLVGASRPRPAFLLATGSWLAAILIVLLFFYAIVVRETKLCFRKSYKAWLIVGILFLWLILPFMGVWVAGLGGAGEMAWLFTLGSPATLFSATLNPSAFPDLHPQHFLALSLGAHVVVAGLLAIHLARFRKVILVEAGRSAEPLTPGGSS